MSDWSRRDVLRVSAGAAVAVPMTALVAGTAEATAAPAPAAAQSVSESAAATVDGPVMFCIHDSRRGEVSILHGTAEVVVRDRDLVARILRAARSAKV